MKIKKQSWCVRTVCCWPEPRYQWSCENPPEFGPLEQIRLFVTWIWIKCWQCVFLHSTDMLLLCFFSVLLLLFSPVFSFRLLPWEWGKDHVVSCFCRHKHGWKLYPVVSIVQMLKCHMQHEDADGRNVDTTRMKQTFWHKWCATFWKNVTFFFLPDSRNHNDFDRYLCIKLLLPIDLLLQMFLFSFSANHFVTSGELLPHLHKVKAHQNRCL